VAMAGQLSPQTAMSFRIKALFSSVGQSFEGTR
jgi:hypothetical protein